MLHGHLTHLLNLLSAATPREQRQIVTPHLSVLAVVLQRTGQRVQRRVQTLCHRASHTHTEEEQDLNDNNPVVYGHCH